MSKKLAEVANSIQKKYADTHHYPDFETSDPVTSMNNLIDHFALKGTYISANVAKILKKNLAINGQGGVKGAYDTLHKLIFTQKIDKQALVKANLEELQKLTNDLKMLERIKPSLLDRRQTPVVAPPAPTDKAAE